MSKKKTLAEVRDYLDKQGAKYVRMGDMVRAYCEEIAACTPKNTVARIYSRKDKQPDSPLKSPLQIARKLVRKRKENPDYQVRDVTDIVGSTVVVQYPDQIDSFVEALRQRLANEHIDMKVEPIERPGYYATHIDLISRMPDLRHIKCEVQVKTMLHDSWSAKMHDLNYKPGGVHDHRLDRLMMTLGNTLQSIEVQSETLRNMIMDRWHHDGFWRHTVRKKTLDQVTNWYSSESVMSDEADAIVAIIQNKLQEIEHWEQDATVLNDLTKRVSDLSLGDLRSAWWLAALLGVYSKRQKNEEMAIEIIHEWVDEGIKRFRSGQHNVHASEVWFAPMACQALGFHDTAIDLSETVLEAAEVFPPDDIACTKLNLAHYLLEQSYFAPPATYEDARNRRDRVERLMQDAKQLRNEDPSAFYDAEGLTEVVFGEDADTIRRGIDLIQDGRDKAPDWVREFAEATYELHARMAWRRLAEKENGLFGSTA